MRIEGLEHRNVSESMHATSEMHFYAIVYLRQRTQHSNLYRLRSRREFFFLSAERMYLCRHRFQAAVFLSDSF